MTIVCIQSRVTCVTIWKNILLISITNGQGSGVKRLLRTAQYHQLATGGCLVDQRESGAG